MNARLRWPIVTAACAVLCGVALVAPGQVSSAPLQQGIIATGNGTAGVSQSIDVISPSQAGSSVTLAISLGQTSQQASVSLDRLGVGRMQWTPATSGLWSIASTGFTSTKSTAVAMPTTTQLAIPTNPARYRSLPFIATIETGDIRGSLSGQDIIGKVIFTEVTHGIIGQAVVRSSSGTSVRARIDWAPPGSATYAVTAAFVPSVSTETGGTVYAASTSELAYFTAGLDPKRVQLLMPQTNRVDMPSYVSVTVDDDRKGSVSLTVDGRAVSPDKPIMEWTTPDAVPPPTVSERTPSGWTSRTS